MTPSEGPGDLGALRPALTALPAPVTEEAAEDRVVEEGMGLHLLDAGAIDVHDRGRGAPHHGGEGELHLRAGGGRLAWRLGHGRSGGDEREGGGGKDGESGHGGNIVVPPASPEGKAGARCVHGG